MPRENFDTRQQRSAPVRERTFPFQLYLDVFLNFSNEISYLLNVIQENWAAIVYSF